MIVSGAHDHHRRPRPHETTSKGPVTASERIARSGHIGAAIHLGSRASLATKLERKLFDHGSTVVVLNEWRTEWNSLFKNAPILLLVVAGGEDRFEIHTAAGVVENSRVPLPSDDDEAVDSIYRLLETKQILFPGQSWTESAGI